MRQFESEFAERYAVVLGSQTAHCCFEATVVDTHERSSIFPDQFIPICECFNVEDAQLIANALNAGHSKK